MPNTFLELNFGWFHFDWSSWRTSINSAYHLIDNQCYYFENKTLSHDQAKHNCKNKFRGMGVGKLFEPSSFAMNKIISQRGWTIFGRSVWAFIGVDDTSKESHYVRTHHMFSRILNFAFVIVFS